MKAVSAVPETETNIEFLPADKAIAKLAEKLEFRTDKLGNFIEKMDLPAKPEKEETVAKEIKGYTPPTLQAVYAALAETSQPEALVSLPATIHAIACGKETRCPVLLFTGNSGSGKTYLADTIADILGWEVVRIPTGRKAKEEMEKLVQTRCNVNQKNYTLWFCDESHGAPASLTDFLLLLTDTNKKEVSGGDGEDDCWHWFRDRNLAILASNHGHGNPALESRSEKIKCHPMPREAKIRIMRESLADAETAYGVSFPPTKSAWRELERYIDSNPRRCRLLPKQMVKAFATLTIETPGAMLNGRTVKLIFRDRMQRARQGVERETLAALRYLCTSGPMQRQQLTAFFAQQRKDANLAIDTLRQRGWLVTDTSCGLQSATASAHKWLADYDAETLAIAKEETL